MEERYVGLEEEPRLVYTAEKNRLNAAKQLLFFGIKQFKKTIHFTEKEELIVDLSKSHLGYLSSESILSLTNDALVEYFRIVVCFQNYMFASLLNNGYLIHKIDKNKFNDLLKRQKSEPIEISGLVGSSRYKKNSRGFDILEGVENHTINFSTLLKPEYQKLIQFPHVVRKTIEGYNEVRNFNHFHIKETTAPILVHVKNGENYCEGIDQIREVNNFVENNMVKLHNDLIDQLGAPSDDKIDIQADRNLTKISSYGDFSLESIRKQLGVTNHLSRLFTDISPVAESDNLRRDLQIASLLPARSEKAKSELIVMPILIELMTQNDNFFTIYSGEILAADTTQGLTGECDFILARNTGTFDIDVPMMIVVEAKKHDIDIGIPQCAAQMIGVQAFNRNRDEPIDIIYGCVTTGDTWLFMKLEKDRLLIDDQKYYLNDLNRLLGIFQHIIDYYKSILNPA